MMFDRDAIHRIFRDYVLVNNTPEYLERYDGVAFAEPYIDKINFSRVIAIREFARLVQKYGIKPRNLLMYNGGPEGDPELAHIKPEKTLCVDYNEATEANDLHRLDLADKQFDFFLFSQTLEHVYDPFGCVRRIHDHMIPGGYVFTSVPVVNISHNAPVHFYTGFTPVGLGLLFERSGFEIVEIGQWGNLKYIYRMFESVDWPLKRYLRKGYHDHIDRRFPFHMLRDGCKNDFGNPVDAWILAKKREHSGP